MLVDLFLERIGGFVVLLLSLTVHEWAHAWTAARLGDLTAQSKGRVSLDPTAHMDPIGTFVLPLLGIPFGWAVPVPVEPTRFRADITMAKGMMWTAAAGPLSNLAIACVCCPLVWLQGVPEGRLGQGFASLVDTAVVLNVSLAAFNLLPLPPLDGSRLVDAFLPKGLRPAWSALQNASGIPLAVIVVVPIVLGVSPFLGLVTAVLRGLAALRGGA